MEYFLKALEEIYSVSEVDRFGESAAVWRAVLTKLQTTTHVDYTNAGALSNSYTALLLETNTKHPLDKQSNQKDILKDLPKVFVSTHNPNRNNRTNKAFSDELEEQLKLDAQYVLKPSLTSFLLVCEKLLNSWQRDNYNEGQRSGKRKDTSHEPLNLSLT